MKKIITVFLLLLPGFLLAQTSIYDIQYTTTAGDGTYPSLYNYQTVTTGGIVTANNFSDGRYFISSSAGGAWNGLFVYDNSYSPSIGDSIIITGTIYEYNGYTEIKDLTSFSVESQGNALPEPTVISTSEIYSEQYEGVLVKVSNCDVSSVYDQYNNWKADDGSGECKLRPAIYNLKEDLELFLNYPFESITGVIGFSYGEISMFPRSQADIVSASNAFVLSTDDKFVQENASFSYPVRISLMNQTNTITSYSLKMQYDATMFAYEGYTSTGTISESGSITDASSSGSIELNYSGTTNTGNNSILVYLNFSPISEGNASLSFNSPTINGSVINYVTAGNLEHGSDPCDIPQADTLSVVERPVLNIPSIVTPGQQLSLECFASETTTNWGVELFYGDITIPLTVDQANYNSELEKWTLTTTIPSVDLYELYDLRVTASDGIFDEVTNAVKIIDQYKEDYYFIHITDAHLPGHTFYGEAGYETDHSELEDFEEVIKDINLLNPEFVLLTGDLINEGELEDFECLRNHTLAVEMLEKFEVPVYIVPGNHDLGGWDATPPPDGTARQEWWRFFGPIQREIPPTQTEYLTQDYSFDYGTEHYVGLEAYDNYDGYMYDVYGATSFISSQITWLQNDLQNAGNSTKILFYHYDFKDELDLNNLGVDMALWGHIHSNVEDATHPYDISTASVCDENRSYRVVRVNNGSLQAEATVRSHTSQEMLTLNFNMENNGTLDIVSATIQNNHSLSFDHALVKFVMPVSEFGYTVTNGSLLQVFEHDTTATCYVEVSIPGNDQVTTTIEKRNTDISKTIHEIQYTTNAGDGTYASDLNGQLVETGGIVTATNYFGGHYFISSSQGGDWNGILIYDDTYSPEVGDSILITATVSEYSGYTELVDVSSFQVVSSGNTLPAAKAIATNEILDEALEGVLVEVNNCTVTGGYDQYGNFSVDDGTGSCDIKTGIYSLLSDEFPLMDNYTFKKIAGVVGINSGHNTIHPRSLDDFVASDDGFILFTDDYSTGNNSEISYPVQVSVLQPSKDINAYNLKASYNAEVFQYNGFNKTTTVSGSGSVSDNSSEGNIDLSYSGSASFQKTDNLINLLFTPISSGSANIQLDGTTLNGYDLKFASIGNLQSTYEGTTAIMDSKNELNLNVFPNPFKDKMLIEFELQHPVDVQISIYNMEGKLVKRYSRKDATIGKHRFEWDASDLTGSKVTPGTYFYEFRVNQKKRANGQILLAR